MSWIKPNFLWVMYRSGWGTKAGQELTLALRLRRSFFNGLPALPDHAPGEAPITRRAIQIGLRGDDLEAFSRRELLEVIDLSEFVAQNSENACSGPDSTDSKGPANATIARLIQRSQNG
jgi:hypothetical protein